MKKVLMILLCGAMVLGITGCGSSNETKLTKKLEEDNFKCNKSSDETICTKEDNEVKKVFTMSDYLINYEETIYDSGTTRLVIEISNQHYNDNSEARLVNAYFKGEDLIQFYPETCDDGEQCKITVNEKVYPRKKDEYDWYKNYKNSEQYREYMELKNKRDKTLSEEYREFSLETAFDKYIEIKDDDVFTDNVNSSLRYFEKTLEDAGITLGK